MKYHKLKEEEIYRISNNQEHKMRQFKEEL